MKWSDYIFIEKLELPWHSWDRIKKKYPEAYKEAKKKGYVKGDGRTWSKRDLKKVSRVIIHQTAGGDSPEATNKYHTRPNHVSPYGMPHIAYHFYIPKEPKTDSRGRVCVWQVNPVEDRAWHTKGNNGVGVGVVCGGSFYHSNWRGGKEHPTMEQMKGTRGIWLYLKERFNLTDRDLYGHFHFGKSACPGEKLENWIKVMRLSSEYYFDEEHWEDIQFALTELGYAPGKIDGIFGPKTRGAVSEFEDDYKMWGLVADGYWDDMTRDVLEKVWEAHKGGEKLAKRPVVLKPDFEKEFGNK